MKLEYISHSCFVIETNNTRVAFDPWISPTAYHKQWYLHPKPVNAEPAVESDIVLISHGHEDHLNHDSLKFINKDAHIFFPFQWRKGIDDYLHHVGFQKVTEAVSFKTYNHKNISITYLGYSLESVIVVECEGFVIVNINDALNSNHETAVAYLLKEIKSRWPKIDFLLSGWSGAGYFPNKVHYQGKDDVEVARIREQYFANNFCRFTKYLQPEIAIAFAPGFVLLSDENRWINEIKFPREILPGYYSEHFEKDSPIQFPLAYPGDYFIDKEFHKTSSYHNFSSEKEIYSNLDSLFKDEIAQANKIEYVSNEEVNVLEHTLTYWLNRNKSLYHADVIHDAVFSIMLKDVQELNYFNICFKDDEAIVCRRDKPAHNDKLIIETKAALLALNLSKEWGGDLLSIGYGINVEVFDELSLEKNLDLVCVRLISRFPNFKDDFLSHSPRALKYYFSNPGLTNLWLTQKLKLKPYVNKYPFNERDHWITYNKCDLCKVCNMPEVDFNEMSRAVAL
jgi:hypothetical protein